MELGELFDRGFRIWKDNVKVGFLFLAGSLLSWIPILIFVAFLLYLIGTEAIWVALHYHSEAEVMSILKAYALPIVSVFILSMIASFVVYEFFRLAAIRACSLSIDGRMEFGAAIEFAKRRLLTMIGAEILRYIALLAPLTLLIASFLYPSPLLVLFLGLIGLILSVFLGILLVYVPYAVAEGYGAVESIKASYSVARRKLLETVVIIIVVILIHAACRMISEFSIYTATFSFYAYSHAPSCTPLYTPALASLGATLIISIILVSFVAQPLAAIFYLLFFRENVSDLGQLE